MDSQNPVIAVIDDNPVNRLLARRALEDVAEIVEYATMSGFLQSLQDFEPDMAFVDLMMPGENIPEMLAGLAQTRTPLMRRIIVLTADPRVPAALTLRSMDIIGVFERPFLRTDFLSLMQGALDRPANPSV